jgi:hypothetical protein
MTSVRLGVQTAIVIALVVFVSLPDAARVKGADEAARANARPSESKTAHSPKGSSRHLQYEIGYGSISVQRATAATATPLQRKLYEDGIDMKRQRTPLSVLTLGGRVNGILGEARTTLNAPVPFARIVLRDPVTGRIEARAVADDQGQFTFLDILPSGYVIELIGPNDSVFATSDVVTVGLGELRQAVVRLSDSREMLGTFGTLTPTANEPIAAAAENGINAVTAPDRNLSPQR